MLLVDDSEEPCSTGSGPRSAEVCSEWDLEQLMVEGSSSAGHFNIRITRAVCGNCQGPGFTPRVLVQQAWESAFYINSSEDSGASRV